MHQSFFVTSGEHVELARDEITSIAKSYDKKAVIKSDSRLVTVRSKIPYTKIAPRATFVKISGTLVGTVTGITQIRAPVAKPSSFACRVVNLSTKTVSSLHLEKEIGTILKQKWNSKVSLSNPHVTVYLIVTNSRKYMGYSKRQVEPKRPEKLLKYPHELDSNLARCMVNLSGLKQGQTLCDPFCGTGTILLEAESMGINAIGIDFDPEMCGITKRNLALNGFKSRVINAGYHDIKKMMGKIDAIVTDLPYGISSKSSMEPERLVKDFVSAIPKKKKLVMVYKKGFDVAIKAKKYEIYRHKSLTRVIVSR
ncbi:MAG: DNA methyltransferase [Nitrososphaera sp.]|jgi:tRNA (guanine10-N2)-dimethyltransferase